MKLVAVKKHDPDSLQGRDVFLVVCTNETAAKKWIQEEVDGKHPDSKTTYMQGQTADWWIQQGYFSLNTIELHTDI